VKLLIRPKENQRKCTQYNRDKEVATIQNFGILKIGGRVLDLVNPKDSSDNFPISVHYNQKSVLTAI